MSDELDMDWKTVTWRQLIAAIRKQKAESSLAATAGSTAHGSWYDVFYTDAAGEIQIGECYALTLADAKLIAPLMYPRVQEIEYKPESVR